MKEDELKDLNIVSISLAFVCLMCPGPLSLNVPSRPQPFVLMACISAQALEQDHSVRELFVH